MTLGVTFISSLNAKNKNKNQTNKNKPVASRWLQF